MCINTIAMTWTGEPGPSSPETLSLTGWGVHTHTAIMLDSMHGLRHTGASMCTVINTVYLHLLHVYINPYNVRFFLLLCTKHIACVCKWHVYMCSRHVDSPSQRAYNWKPCKLIRWWSHPLSFNEPPTPSLNALFTPLSPCVSPPCREHITSMDIIPSSSVWKTRVESHSESFSWTAMLWVKI